jgi:hypothetical protein
MTGSNTPRANSMTGKRVRRWPLRPVSAVILLVLAAVAVASCLITRNVVADQERLILREQTAEVAATVGSGFAGAQSSLQLLGEIARSNKDHPQPKLFAAEARTVTTASTQGWLVTTQSGTSLRVTASAGNGPASGHLTPVSWDSWVAGLCRLKGWHRALCETTAPSGLPSP